MNKFIEHALEYIEGCAFLTHEEYSNKIICYFEGERLLEINDDMYLNLSTLIGSIDLSDIDNSNSAKRLFFASEVMLSLLTIINTEGFIKEDKNE